MDPSTLRDIGRGTLGLALLVGLGWGAVQGPGALPWAWLLGAMAVGFVLLAYSDVIDARAAQRRLDLIEDWERQFPEEE